MSNRYPAIGDSIDIRLNSGRVRPGIIIDVPIIAARVGHTGETYGGLTRLDGSSLWKQSNITPTNATMQIRSTNDGLRQTGVTLKGGA